MKINPNLLAFKPMELKQCPFVTIETEYVVFFLLIN